MQRGRRAVLQLQLWCCLLTGDSGCLSGDGHGGPGMLQSLCWVWSLRVLQRNLRETFPSLKALKGKVRAKGQWVC